MFPLYIFIDKYDSHVTFLIMMNNQANRNPPRIGNVVNTDLLEEATPNIFNSL